MEFGLSTSFLHLNSIDDMVRFCREADISNLELWDHDGFFAAAENAAEVRAHLQRAGVRVRSLHAPFIPGASLPRPLRDCYIDRFRFCCEKGRHYGAGYVVVHPLLVEGETPVPDKLRESAPESVLFWKELAAAAASEGLHIAYENIPAGKGWPAGCTWRTVRGIAEAAGETNAGTCLDISHAFANGELADVLFTIETGPLPLCIHVSDGVYGAGGDRHLPPGEGDMDWPAFFTFLAKRRFSGNLIIEVNSPHLSGQLVRSISRFLQAHSTKKEVM